MFIVIALFFDNTEKDVENCDISGPWMYCEFMVDEVETQVRPPRPPRLLHRGILSRETYIPHSYVFFCTIVLPSVELSSSNVWPEGSNGRGH